MNIGVLALQGAFREHKIMLESLGCNVTEVRLPKHLEGLNGIIFPGGESTTIGKLMVHYGFLEALTNYYNNGGAIFATCAGAILLATDIVGSDQPRLGLLEMSVKRNAFGRQVDSFQTPLDICGLETPFPALFIRAPILESVGNGVEVLATFENQIVLARKDRLLASSFHPELTADTRLHKFFLEQVIGS
jgi:pyridoxal 5'-phosphate synthase pdxT subunit